MKRLAPLALLGLVMAGCASSPSPVEPPAPLKAFKPALRVHPVWESQLDSGTAGQYLALSPAVDGDLLYAAARHGLLRAYDIATGHRVWSKSLGLPISTGIVDAGDILLFGSDSQVIAFDRTTTQIRWRAPLESEIVTDPVRAGDVIVVRTVDGSLYGLNAKDGSRRWRNNDEQVPLLSMRGESVPVPVGDVVIAGFANGRVAAVALQDGHMVWETLIAEPRGRTELERLTDVDGQIIVGEGVVFAAGFNGRVAALDLPTGRLVWARDISSYQGIASAPGSDLYVSDALGNVWALSKNNGATLWRQPDLHGRSISTPILQGDAVLVGDYNGYLHWISREDGRFLARKRVKNFDESFPVPPSESDLPKVTSDRNIVATPVVSGDMVFAVDERGAISAFRVDAGAQKP